MTSYDAAFYADLAEGSRRSARAVLPIVFGALRPQSVIDIGCGHGAWLAVAEELGARELTGLDGSWVDRAALQSATIDFRPTDLSGSIVLERRFDLCVSVEVAEHLPAAKADAFVGALCDASDAVLFSAAVPGQGGTDHVNEARASQWITRFERRGYDCFDLVRGALWDRADVEWWYRQNALIFVARATAAHARFASAPVPLSPRDLVHPEAFEGKLAWSRAEERRLRDWVERPSLGQALRMLWRAVRGRLTRVVRPGPDQ